jgi:SecD/SecF fusion protein
VIRKRVDQFGVSEPIITPQGSDRILIQIPGLDPAHIVAARQQLAQVAKLEFRLVHPESDRLVAGIEAGTELVPPGYRVETQRETHGGRSVEEKLLIKQRPDLLGDRVTQGFATFDEQGWEWHCSSIRRCGNVREIDGGIRCKRFAIVLDGRSNPRRRFVKLSMVRASITGNFTEEEARNLASVLKTSATPVSVEEERSVSATLGADSIKSGVYAGVLGSRYVPFVLIYYRFAGLVANLALVINLVLLFGAMTIFHFVLTLPGIAGIILTIGMAVDANVLIYGDFREDWLLESPCDQPWTPPTRRPSARSSTQTSRPLSPR